MIAIINMGIGNVGSVKNMLNRLGANVEITTDKATLASAKAIIIPGVGNFDAGIKAIKSLDCFTELEKIALSGNVPILGICLGMQLMTKSSMEGHEKGLGWVDAVTERLVEEDGKIPNMGWRYVEYINDTFISPPKDIRERFYFVHSYSVKCKKKEIIAIVSQGDHSIVASYVSGNIVGVQFHPEKSHVHGFSFFKRWLAFYQLI